MRLELCTIDWAAVGAIASFAMILVTWLSLRQMRRQWDEERRPRINFSIVVSQTWFMLKISNIGQQNAHNIILNFNREFIEALPEISKGAFEKLQTKPLAIETGCSKYYLISAYQERENICNELIIRGKYCNRYSIKEDIRVDEYLSESVIVDNTLTTDVSYIKKGLITQNNQHYSIQKSLDIIAKRIEKITKES